ncbi:hypothetical protein HW555_003560 [Spodoptera exigua]|uniref:Uncharacterized protein n=1 Tax=Spodoptera exigua TaxID=7107 RepID=A0A835GKZ4_SPOEX|nr:hypothetical protein HW555_003560 [Spodoptera exigua]
MATTPPPHGLITIAILTALIVNVLKETTSNNEAWYIRVLLGLLIAEFCLTFMFAIAGHKKNVRLMRIYYCYCIVMLVINGVLMMVVLTLITPPFYSQTALLSVSKFFCNVTIQCYFILLLRSEIFKLENLSRELQFPNNLGEVEAGGNGIVGISYKEPSNPIAEDKKTSSPQTQILDKNKLNVMQVILALFLSICLYHEIDFYIKYSLRLDLYSIVICCLLLGALVIEFCFTLAFVIGGHMKNKKILRVFYIYNIVIWIISFILMVILTILMLKDLDPSRILVAYSFRAFVYSTATFFFILMTQIYFILLIRSEISILKGNYGFSFVNNAVEAECNMRRETQIEGDWKTREEKEELNETTGSVTNART